MKYPESFNKLIESFEMFPGIGPKTAERLAFFTVLKMNKEDARDLSDNIINAINNIKYCSNCKALSDTDLCEICSDKSREATLMVVENSKDVITFEKTENYNGKYHVLNGAISPLNGVGPDDINLNTLVERVEKEKITDIIVATSSTIEGEMTSLYIKKMFENTDVNVYRIGYGLPAGADIEYIDEITLIKALESKRKI